MSRYTREIQTIVKATPCPYPGFIVDVVEYPGSLMLRVYGPNVEQYSTPQKVELAQYLYVLRDAIRATGTRCHVQGSPDDPPAKKNQEVK